MILAGVSPFVAGGEKMWDSEPGLLVQSPVSACLACFVVVACEERGDSVGMSGRGMF